MTSTTAELVALVGLIACALLGLLIRLVRADQFRHDLTTVATTEETTMLIPAAEAVAAAADPERYRDMREQVTIRALQRTAGRPVAEQAGEVLRAVDAWHTHYWRECSAERRQSAAARTQRGAEVIA